MSIKQLIDYGYIPSGVRSYSEDDRNILVEDAIKLFRLNMNAPDGLSDEELFNIPRCGEPDYPSIDAGSGSWPVGCNPDNPTVNSVRYYVNKSNMPSFLSETFEASWDLMRKAYANVGLEIIRSNVVSNYNSLVTFERGRGWIGLAIVGRGQRCSTKMWAKFDTRYGSSFSVERLIHQWSYLLAHEIGHNCGLSHTRGGIMNAGLINGTFNENQWNIDIAYPTMKRWYGGSPIKAEAPIWTIPSPEQPRE